jgi:hypothetical protein
VISVVVLQNIMDLLKGELGSSRETCATSTLDVNEVPDMEAEMVSVKTEEEDQDPMTIPVIKIEPIVSDVCVVSIKHISYRLYPEFLVHVLVCPCQIEICL